MILFKRENYLKRIRGFYQATDIIKVITGVRRCGKSSLMQIIAEELCSSGVAESAVIFLNLDKREYRKIKTADQLDALISSFQRKHDLMYLFIDEVQNVEGFEEILNGYREDGGYSIFITGSNSYLLSGELTTKLTGRYIELEMFPLTFDEYLQMKAFYHKEINSNLLLELNSFILEGGFPRSIQFDSIGDKRTYTSSVVDEIYEKDIRKRVKIKDRVAFDAVRRFIVNNFGATTSINSLHEALLKNGMSITRQTVTKYIRALLDAKILYECERFDMKSKRALKGEKKYYLSDLSFYFCDNTDNRINYGPVLENLVYCYTKSRGYNVSVGRIGSLECDFILRDREMQYSYLQVAYTIAESQDTEEREYRPLEQIRDNYPKYLLTTDYLLQKRSGIHHVNLAEFIRDGHEF
jgi:hypothetical protein